MKRTLLILAIALLAGFFSRDGWKYLTAEPPATVAAPAPATPVPQAVTAAETPAPSPQEITPDAVPYQATGPRVISDYENLVAEGETVITQGYFDTYRGMFVFHTFTPTLETQANGQTVVHVQAENFNVGLNGDYESNQLTDFILTPNNIRSVSVIREGSTLNVALGAKVDPATSMILLSASASSEPNNLGTPAADE